MTHKYSNNLVHETSPYLLQHAHNPVNWEAWNPSVLERAKNENKLLLISIGYAACHWCHVMEQECFEDEEVANTMNKNFISIKIDREERPDIDHIYMDALQMMTGSGGWPLNVVALPDGRPFWGATYVKKEDWISVLNQISTLYQKNPDKVVEYAQNLAEGIKSINLVENKKEATVMPLAELDKAVKKWSSGFDQVFGGNKRAPKFMMPNNLEFLLHYATSRKDAKVMDYVNTTLTKMAYGGIYDHVGGGFSRYSVDAKWHVPHFEKMLYDNGQLISLYSHAYAVTKNELYRKVAEETISFVVRELMDAEYAFFSSLDADSLNKQGTLEEGAYYVWTESELKGLLGTDFTVFKDYFNINGYGLWEHGNYVLIRNLSDQEIIKKNNINIDKLQTIITNSKEVLYKERNKRSKPRLDDKILTSWNGLMLKGLVDAYKYLGNEEYLNMALKNVDFIEKKLTKEDGSLFRNHKNGKSTLNAYLEDYAAVIDAYISLYEASFDEKWLWRSKELMDHCLENFFDDESKLFFFTSKKDDFVIRRTIETNDNVISSSNSIMSKNLFKLSRFFIEDEKYESFSLKMLGNVQDNFDENAQSYANWLHNVLYNNLDFFEVAIVGSDYMGIGREINSHYLPNSITAGTRKDSDISLLQGRFDAENTLIYVCLQGSCKLPETETEIVLSKMQKGY